MNLDDILTATREVERPDATTLTRGRDATLASVHDDLKGRARIARRRTHRRVISVAAVAAAAVVAFVAIPGGEDAPDQIATPKAPVVEVDYVNASQIVAAAATASGYGADELGDAPYWKVVSKHVWTGSDAPETNNAGKRTSWLGIAGPGALTDTWFGRTETLEVPQATLTAGGHTYTWPEINAGALNDDQIHDLLAGVEEGIPAKNGRPPHEWYFFKQAGELLADTPASPAFRKAIWNELATLTGVTTSGKVTDAAGREGWNLTFTVDGHGTQRFIVDPTTGAILQAEVERPGSTYRTTYLKAGPADTAPAPTQESQRMPVHLGDKVSKGDRDLVLMTPTPR